MVLSKTFQISDAASRRDAANSSTVASIRSPTPASPGLPPSELKTMPATSLSNYRPGLEHIPSFHGSSARIQTGAKQYVKDGSARNAEAARLLCFLRRCDVTVLASPVPLPLTSSPLQREPVGHASNNCSVTFGLLSPFFDSRSGTNVEMRPHMTIRSRGSDSRFLCTRSSVPHNEIPGTQYM